jgi:predicted DNA-binding protein
MSNQKHLSDDLAVKTVTIRLPRETARLVRMLAARSDKTVSAFFRDYAEQVTGHRKSYVSEDH